MTPLNGTVTSNGTLAVYTCDTGYAVSEGAERSCADNGTGWSGVQPLCGECFLKSTKNGLCDVKSWFLHMQKHKGADQLSYHAGGSASLLFASNGLLAVYSCDIRRGQREIALMMDLGGVV